MGLFDTASGGEPGFIQFEIKPTRYEQANVKPLAQIAAAKAKVLSDIATRNTKAKEEFDKIKGPDDYEKTDTQYLENKFNTAKSAFEGVIKETGYDYAQLMSGRNEKANEALKNMIISPTDVAIAKSHVEDGKNALKTVQETGEDNYAMDASGRPMIAVRGDDVFLTTMNDELNRQEGYFDKFGNQTTQFGRNPKKYNILGYDFNKTKENIYKDLTDIGTTTIGGEAYGITSAGDPTDPYAYYNVLKGVKTSDNYQQWQAAVQAATDNLSDTDRAAFGSEFNKKYDFRKYYDKETKDLTKTKMVPNPNDPKGKKIEVNAYDYDFKNFVGDTISELAKRKLTSSIDENLSNVNKDALGAGGLLDPNKYTLQYVEINNAYQSPKPVTANGENVEMYTGNASQVWGATKFNVLDPKEGRKVSIEGVMGTGGSNLGLLLGGKVVQMRDEVLFTKSKLDKRTGKMVTTNGITVYSPVNVEYNIDNSTDDGKKNRQILKGMTIETYILKGKPINSDKQVLDELKKHPKGNEVYGNAIAKARKAGVAPVKTAGGDLFLDQDGFTNILIEEIKNTPATKNLYKTLNLTKEKQNIYDSDGDATPLGKRLGYKNLDGNTVIMNALEDNSNIYMSTVTSPVPESTIKVNDALSGSNGGGRGVGLFSGR